MEMNEIGSLQLPDQVNLPFAITSTGDYFVTWTKGSVECFQLKYKHVNEDGALNFILSRFECSKEKPTGQIMTKEVDIYNNSNRYERARIMLDQTMIPNVATLYISNVLAAVSPQGLLPDYSVCLVANLTNMGQLSILRFDDFQNEWVPYVDVSATWLAHCYDNSVVKKFDHLRSAVSDALITSFCWRDHAFRQVGHFAIGTKSGTIVLYSLMSDSVSIQYIASVNQPVRMLKWITISEERNLLLVRLQNGKIGLYGFKTMPDASVIDFEQLNNVWAEEDNLMVGQVQSEVDYDNGRLLILVVKGTHLLIFSCSLQGEIRAVAVENMNNFMITGLQQLAPHRYIVCTLPGMVFCVDIKIIKGDQLLIEHTPVKTDLNLSKYSIYGVTASRNRSCWLFIGYPSKSFDRLGLRTPTVVFFCKFNACDALQLLLNNPTLRMTNFYDCAEVVRFSGNRNPDAVKPLELRASHSANVDDSYAYHLKLQLVQLGARLSHFKKRCQAVAEVLYNQLQFLRMVIEILHAAKVIAYFLHVRHALSELSYQQLLTIRCLRNFIQEFVEDNFPGDYEHVHLLLKPPMEEVITRANELLATSQQELYPEECTFCDGPIPDTKLSCAENHQTFRCSITKQQIAMGHVETMCEMCDRCSLDGQLLAEIFCADGGQLVIYWMDCCLCDMPFRKHVIP
ncbi:hypothetical protein RP20_CCG011395 [Aedes albopictus]|nr:uncharacterized protein LOC109399417 [Aedes albopictus]KXJ75620.1 hypothetical protein RP20_CCG011395 [Aedes albopictus]